VGPLVARGPLVATRPGVGKHEEPLDCVFQAAVSDARESRAIGKRSSSSLIGPCGENSGRSDSFSGEAPHQGEREVDLVWKRQNAIGDGAGA
jgi:hypothetical protein